MIDRLEADGLVYRINNPRDRRSVARRVDRIKAYKRMKEAFQPAIICWQQRLLEPAF